MTHQQEFSGYLTVEQKVFITEVRKWLGSVHSVDTSSLTEMEMAARLAIIAQIANNMKLDARHLPQVIAEHSDKFMDLIELVGEMLVAAEGTRH